MRALATAWSRLAQPSLLQRTVLSLLLAFVAVFAVLLGYAWLQARQTLDNHTPGARYGDALLLALDPRDEDEAIAVLRATDTWLNIRRRQEGRLPGTIHYTLHDAAGRQVYRSPQLAGAVLPNAPGLHAAEVDGVPHRVYEARSPRWRLQVVEPWRSAGQILSYNARFLLTNLLLALPFVLVPVWLSARNGLRPLQLLADSIASRSPDDLRPIGAPVRHRELRPLSEALDSLFLRLRGRIERERGFVQDAAHELRTPLAVIGAQADVLAQSPDPQRRREAHAQLTQAIARASHLTRQLLVLAALDDAQQPALRPVDVAQALRQLLAQAEPAARARRIELSLEAPDTLWHEVDEAALESIVCNLVDNAVRYGRPGGNIAVRLAAPAGGLVLEVRDDGPGIAPEERARVFERFWRGAGHDTPGSGLGLAIVRQAALRMRGTTLLGEGLGGRGVGFAVCIPAPPRLAC